mmetsp:Transcript_9809/g.24219  ORF Transcript_9809/g.24219 Transcript_9809/m.24219 type:complete len:218 (-) Transcript_9809:273-926(-)
MCQVPLLFVVLGVLRILRLQLLYAGTQLCLLCSCVCVRGCGVHLHPSLLQEGLCLQHFFLSRRFRIGLEEGNFLLRFGAGGQSRSCGLCVWKLSACASVLRRRDHRTSSGKMNHLPSVLVTDLDYSLLRLIAVPICRILFGLAPLPKNLDERLQPFGHFRVSSSRLGHREATTFHHCTEKAPPVCGPRGRSARRGSVRISFAISTASRHREPPWSGW